MDPGGLLAAACEQAGLDDFGDDRFREGLDVYCRSVAEEAQLNDIGAMAVPGNVVGNLVNRLQIVEWRRQHPEVADEVIEAPLFVIGVFRAGTTFLSYLLDRDAENRPLLRWESADSTPPPTPPTFRSGPRVEAARAAGGMLDTINPGFKAIHHEEADGPTECVALLSQDFKSLLWESITNVPSYGRWLLSTDHTSAYEHERDCLQVLSSGGVRGRWTLKSPHHALALDALTAVFPDARLVMLHRDPVVVMASVCSLIRSLSGTFSSADHGAYINARYADLLEASYVGASSFGGPITHVHYADLVRDPVATVASIYDSIGWTLSSAAESSMADHVAANPKGKFGTHAYDLASLSLDEGAIRERFGGWVERYGIEAEAGR